MRPGMTMRIQQRQMLPTSYAVIEELLATGNVELIKQLVRLVGSRKLTNVEKQESTSYIAQPKKGT
jgi:hypothetical protein